MIRDYAILVAECLVIQKVILKTTQKGIQRVIIRNDPQLVVNSINGKVHVPK